MLLSLSNSIQLRLLQDRCGCLRSSLYPLARLIAFTLFVRFGYIPPAAERAIKVDHRQFAAEVVCYRGALRRIQLDLSINNLEIAGKSTVVPYKRHPD